MLVHELVKGKKYAIANSPTSWAWVLEPGADLCMQNCCARFFPSTVMSVNVMFASMPLSAVLSFELCLSYNLIQLFKEQERLFWKCIIQTSDLYSIFPLVLYDSSIHTSCFYQSQLCSVVSVNLSSLNSLNSHFTSNKDASVQLIALLNYPPTKRLCLFQSALSLSASTPLRKCSFIHLIRPCPLVRQTLIVT